MQAIGSVLTQRQTQSAEDPDGDALLLEQLKALSDWAHGSTSLAIKLASPQERRNCMAVVRNFYNHVINEFPLPGEYAWDACNEKVRLTEASFDVFSLVGAAFCAEDDFREFSRQFLTRVLNICRILEEWIDVQDTHTRPGYPTPRELYEKGELACIGLLRAWFGCLKAEVKDVRGWQVAKEITVEWITLIQEFLNGGLSDEPMQVHLFSAPHLHSGPDDTRTPSFTIKDKASYPLFLTSMLRIVLESLRPSILSSWFVTDVFRNTADCSVQAYHFLLAPFCTTSELKRTRSMARLAGAMVSALSVNPAYEGIAEATRLNLLVQKLSDGPSTAWNTEEQSLQGVFSTKLSVTPSYADVQVVLSLLGAEQWGDSGDCLRTLAAVYLNAIVTHLDETRLNEVKASLSRTQYGTRYYELLGNVERRLEQLRSATGSQDVAMATAEGTVLEFKDWRYDVKAIVQNLMAPEPLSWMDDGDSLRESQFTSRALTEVDNLFKGIPDHLAADARVSLAKQLARLPCAIARHADSVCPSTPSRISVSLLPMGLRAAIVLTTGTPTEVTPAVEKAVYDALVRVVRHHTSGFGIAITGPTFELALKGMKSNDRSARLSAGRCVAELVKMLQDKGTQGTQQIKTVFRNIDAMLNRCPDRVKETMMISLGLIARQANSEILYSALIALISQLGDKNPVIKGTTFMQLTSISGAKGKSTVGLLQPYVNQLAVYVVDNMETQSTLLAEFCKFLFVTVPAFFEATLDATLPHLFATCNETGLRVIAGARSCTLVELFWQRHPKIIAHAYMVTAPGQRQKIVKFIIKRLADGGQRVGGVEDLIGSGMVEIVSELVLKMGDEDEAVVQAAEQGLMKIADTMRSKTSQVESTPGDTLGAFLEARILGVLTHMVEILEDVKTKQSLQEKRCVCRAIGKVVQQIGPSVSTVAPQIMAMLQTMLAMPDLQDTTLTSWNTFLRVLEVKDVGPYAAPTGAAFLTAWPSLSWHGKEVVKDCLSYLVIEIGGKLERHLDELADLRSVPELRDIEERLAQLRKARSPEEKLQALLARISSENLNVASRAMDELRMFLVEDRESFVRNLTSGDVFPATIAALCSTLLSACSRDGDSEQLRMLAFDCLGILGAVDPYRTDVDTPDGGKYMVVNNFQDESETLTFVIHLVRDVLVGAYRSTSDMQYQRDLAYAIQELLKISGFSTTQSTPGAGGSMPLRARARWNELPKSVVEAVTPLLRSEYKIKPLEIPPRENGPIYHQEPTYREWLQKWTPRLISQAAASKASQIFGVFSGVVRNRDVGVARYLLPHLILHILISGSQSAVDEIRSELLAILEDQVAPSSRSTQDKKDLSAQTVFVVMDHLNRWVRNARQGLAVVKKTNKRPRSAVDVEDQMVRVSSVLSNFDQVLMATAALQCKAYARALMCFEQQIVEVRETTQNEDDLQGYYERLHEIYAQLDEPDGMEGSSTLIIAPSLEHQIRQHESSGQWTSAQSCWEVNLQQDPNDLRSHLGLLRCLRHLGHYDTMRTHVEGLLPRYPEWKPDLIGFQVECECIVGAWDKVRDLVRQTDNDAAPVVLGRILLAMLDGDEELISTELKSARRTFGAPITAVGGKGYSRCYDAVLNLHLVHELEVIYREATGFPLTQGDNPGARFEKMQKRLSARLEATLPSNRVREPILSIRRTAFSLKKTYDYQAKEAIGQSWLLSAKLARKAGYWNTAYSAVLQAQYGTPAFTIIESAKLSKASGDPVRAFQELDSYYQITKQVPDGDTEVVDLTEPDKTVLLKAKAFLLRARWMNDSNRYEGRHLLTLFQEANKLLQWESGQFHWGEFQDQCFKELPKEPEADYIKRGNRMNVITIKCYCAAVALGSKHVYQTVPRLLTLWLDLGAQPVQDKHCVDPASTTVWKAYKSSPKYKWYTAFPQMLSRVQHTNKTVFGVLRVMIEGIVQAYPHQALWMFASVVHSSDQTRSHRARDILNKVKSQGSCDQKLVSASVRMGAELLELCNRDPLGKTGLNMSKDFPRLKGMAPSPLLIPLQESLIANIPTAEVDEATYKPFPVNAPQIVRFNDEIDVMKSLAHPKKISIIGSDGVTYKFLGKPKDDLRKDARLMDFNAIINKFLKSDSESRRRQLHIRTYGVVTLNEDCGFIQWVPNTMPLRHILTGLYANRGISSWDPVQNAVIGDALAAITKMDDKETVRAFDGKILCLFPPVFHEWFIELFPEPSAWLTSRLAYTRTAAVMSMVGYVLGLGDRHCENILLDQSSGDVVHVDFNCLFDKGHRLATPERVPFRLTQNLVDGFGVTGVEGAYRVAAQLSMAILRQNKDCLMAVLDAFVHDPLTEWADDKAAQDRRNRDAARKANSGKAMAQLVGGAGKGKSGGGGGGQGDPLQTPPKEADDFAREALMRIGRKLEGLFCPYRDRATLEALQSTLERVVPTNSLVDMLIREATSKVNLARMYGGWTAWH